MTTHVKPLIGNTELIERRGLTFKIRTGTTDIKAVDEVVQRKAYMRKDAVVFREGDMWLDLGANIGAFTVMAANAGCHVAAFEPERSNIDLIHQNLTLNNLNGKVIVKPFAVTVEGGNAALATCKSERNKYRHTLLTDFHPKWDTIEVPTVSLRSMIEDFRPAGIKMDIEGYEGHLLDSRPDFIGVQFLTFEYDMDYWPDYPDFHRRMDFLREEGFTVYHPAVPAEGKVTFWPAQRTVKCWRES